MEKHVEAEDPPLSKDAAARCFISKQLRQDADVFCHGFVFLCTWWGQRFPGLKLCGSLVTQNMVENDFSQQRQHMGGGKNPDAASVCSTMCLLRNRSGLIQLSQVVAKDKLAYTDMVVELEDTAGQAVVVEWGALEPDGEGLLLLEDDDEEEEA
jgi:hypothetical protein